MATSTEMVKLSVEVEEKFRCRPNVDFNRDSPSFDQLADWVDTYIEASDNGIELLARFTNVTGFSVEKQTRRVVPVVDQ